MLRARIEQALTDITEPLLLTELDSPALRKRLAREARVTMDAFVRSGEVIAFSVQVVDAPDVSAPVIEVRYQEPRRVQQVILRFVATA